MKKEYYEKIKLSKALGIILCFFFPISYFFTQNYKQETRDILNAERIAFITNKLSLSSEEAQKLWPIMNEAEQKRENLRAERNKLRKKAEKELNSLPDKDYEQMLANESKFHLKEGEIFAERQLKLKKIFSAKRILELYIAEDEFKKWLIKNVKNSK